MQACEYCGLLALDGWPIRPDGYWPDRSYADILPAGQGTLIGGQWLNCVPCCAHGGRGCNIQKGTLTPPQFKGLMNKVGGLQVVLPHACTASFLHE